MTRRCGFVFKAMIAALLAVHAGPALAQQGKPVQLAPPPSPPERDYPPDPRTEAAQTKAAPTFAPGAVVYVAADVVRVRAVAKSGPKVKVLANLRIGTPVTIVAAPAPVGWVKVKLQTSPPVTGYAASAFLSPEAPNAGDLLERYQTAMAADDIKAAKSAAERLAALEPDLNPHIERLKAVYEKLGDTENAARLQGYVDGGGVKFIGLCLPAVGKKLEAVLLGAYKPGEAVLPWLTSEIPKLGVVSPETKRLNTVRLALQRSPWFRSPASPDMRSRAMPGTAALDARVRVPIRLNKPGTQRSPRLTLGGGPICGASGDIVSTEPFDKIEPEEADWPGVPRLIKDLLDDTGFKVRSVAAGVIPGPKPMLAVRAGIYDHGRKSEGLSRRDPVVWRVYEWGSGKRLAHVGWPGRTKGHADVRRVSWFKWRRSKARVAVVEYNIDVEAGGAGPRIEIHVFEPTGDAFVATMRLKWDMTM